MPVPTRTILWSQLPEDFQTDGFIEQELANLTFPERQTDGAWNVSFDGDELVLPSPKTKVVVEMRPMDEMWNDVLRKTFPGMDGPDGRPRDFASEDHWDDRGPRAVVSLMRFMERLIPDPENATATDVLNAFLGPAPVVEWETPENPGDVWDGDVSMASEIVSFRKGSKKDKTIALPPITVTGGRAAEDQHRARVGRASDFVDGRHRMFAARMLGLKWIPVMDLRQFVSRSERLSSGTTTVYHGTDPETARVILAEGFAGGWGDAGYGVYFYDNLRSAQKYIARGGWDRSLRDGVILRAEIPSNLLERIEPHPEWPNPQDYATVFWIPLEEDDDDARVVPLSCQVEGYRSERLPASSVPDDRTLVQELVSAKIPVFVPDYQSTVPTGFVIKQRVTGFAVWWMGQREPDRQVAVVDVVNRTFYTEERPLTFESPALVKGHGWQKRLADLVVAHIRSLGLLDADRVEKLPSESADIPFFHGTSPTAARDILRSGFDVTRCGARQRAIRGDAADVEVCGVYLTRNRDLAEGFYSTPSGDLSKPTGGGAVIEARVVGRFVSESAWWKSLGDVERELFGHLPMYDDRHAQVRREAVHRAQQQGFVGFQENADEFVVFDPVSVEVVGAYELTPYGKQTVESLPVGIDLPVESFRAGTRLFHGTSADFSGAPRLPLMFTVTLEEARWYADPYRWREGPHPRVVEVAITSEARPFVVARGWGDVARALSVPVTETAINTALLEGGYSGWVMKGSGDIGAVTVVDPDAITFVTDHESSLVESLPVAVRGAPPEENPFGFAMAQGFHINAEPRGKYRDVLESAVRLLHSEPFNLYVRSSDAGVLGCGHYGCAFALPDFPNWALKITGDLTEAAAWKAVLDAREAGNVIPGVARALAVFAFPLELPDYWEELKPAPRVYGIVVERLNELPPDVRGFLDDYTYRLQAVKGSSSRYWREVGTTHKQLIEGAVRTYGEYGGQNLEAFRQRFTGLVRTLIELRRLGIDVQDVKGDNVMQTSSGDWRISDLGIAHAPEVEIPEVTDIDLPEILRAASGTHEPLAASTPNDKHALLLAAAKAHYEDDSEHFESGCGDVATALKAFADALGLWGVEVTGGYGTLRKRGEQVYDEDEDEWYKATPEPVMHAWLTIDGERFDPTWEVVFGKPGAKYKSDEAALAMVCDVPEPWLVNSRVQGIYDRLVAEGWELPPLNLLDEDETHEPLAASTPSLLAAFEKYEYGSGTEPGFVLTNYEHRPPSTVRGHVTTYEEALRYAASELGLLEGASGRTAQSIAERESWVASLLRERNPLRSTLYVGLLDVNKSQSRLGLGRALYAELEQWARSKGADVAVSVSACFNDRESPLPFWRRMGFHVIYDRGAPEREAVIEKEFPVSTSEALAASTPNDYPWLPLDEITPALSLMKRLGVSEVARSPRGFLAAYKRAKGDKRRIGTTPGSTPNREPYPWWQRRNEFIVRHVGQIQATREPLWNRDGSPTRRHLALVAWAYSPDAKRWKKWLRDL